MNNKEETVHRVKELIGPLLENRQVELVELTCRQEGSRVMLRFLVDTARGITLDELRALNQGIGAILDEHEVMPERYLLEVNSPGLDRPLKTPMDFDRVIGRRLKGMTAVPVNSKWDHLGELINVNDEAILLKTDAGEKVRILLSDIAKAVQEITLR